MSGIIGRYRGKALKFCVTKFRCSRNDSILALFSKERGEDGALDAFYSCGRIRVSRVRSASERFSCAP